MDYRQIIESRYNRKGWQELLYDIFRNKVQFWQQPQRVSVDENMAKSAVYTGKIDLPDGHTIAVYEVELSDNVIIERNRAGIRNLLCSSWRGMGCAGAFMFCYRQNEAVLRFSYVSESFTFGDDGTLKKSSTDTKRFTYLLGEGHRSRTAIQQFENLKKSGLTLKDITKAFSVEALSDLFFDEYKKQYENIIEFVTGKRMVKVANKWEERVTGKPCREIMQEFCQFPDAEKAVRDYVKKLMGRLVFIQFLQKKGWMGCSAGDDWNDGDREFVQNLFAHTTHKNTFVDDVLEPLFNDINTHRTNDLANPVLGADIKVPYLNGGLFERDAYDKTNFPLPAKYMKSLLDFFASYNFTIDENDPDDAEIGVDPEMLGRIFENLLEDNKDKGAFYTPKEIVQYMCRESLIAYLQTDVDDDAVKLQIREFVTTNKAEHLSAALAANIDHKLKDVKICDPAIGSGAFPMGLLRELYACRKAIEDIDDEKAVEIKTDIIQNNIYGVDIEKGAVDIARLRFWLALIVDEKTPHALPNMDFKIMQGNSLLEQYEGVELSGMSLNEQEKKRSRKKKEQTWHQTLAFDEEASLDNIQNAIREYYGTDDHRKKTELRNIINSNVKSYILNLKGCTPDIQRRLENLPIPNDQFFLWHIYFKEVFDKGGFDIVIGNPPYVVTQVEMFHQYDWNTDLYKMFFELSLKQLMHTDSILAFITPKFYLLNKDDAEQRKYFLDKLDLLHFSLCNPFETAVTENVITLLKSCEPSSKFIQTFIYNNGSFRPLPLLDKMYCKGNLYCEMVLGIDEKTIKILNKVKQNGIAFGSIMTSKRGAEISKKSLRETAEGIPSLIGMDMKRYTIGWSATFLSKFHKEYRRLSPFFDNKMIFLRRVAPRLESTYANGVLYAYNKNVYGIRISDTNKWPPQYIVALLNSKVMDFYYKKRFTLKKEEAFPEIQTYLYEQLPIATANQVLQQTIIALVDCILASKKANPLADTSVEEREIDRLVYDLYGLTEDEIKIVEGE